MALSVDPDQSPAEDDSSLRVKRALGQVALFCYRHAFQTLIAVALCAGLAFLGASRLKLDPDVSELLPPSHESVKSLEVLRSKFGGVGNVVLLIRGATPEKRHALAHRLGGEIERLPSVRYVEVERPLEFFEDRSLYYLDPVDLTTIAERLDARRRYEVSRAQLDLDDEAPPPVDLSDIRKKYEGKLERLSGAPGKTSRYYEDETEVAVFVHPTELASDLAFSRRVVADVDGVLARVPPASVDPGLVVELGGRYKKRVDLSNVLARDLAYTGVIALLLVFGYVWFHFRRLLAVGFVMTPLLVGLEFVYGIAGFGFGTLNVLTAFVGAILLGIGIDNGIHMLGRYEEARAANVSNERAVVTAFSEAGRVSVAAALTTAAAFGCLALSDFRAFREFGLLAAAGMLLVLVSYLTLLPALLGLFARYLPGLARPRGVVGLPFVRGMMARAGWLASGLLLLLLGLSFCAPLVRFNSDFAALDRADLPSFNSDPRVNRLLGRSQTPLVFLADSDAQANRLAASLRERMAALGPGATVGTIASQSELVPPDQAAKQPLLERIGKLLSLVDAGALGAQERGDFERLRRMARAEPFTASDLPDAVRKPFEPRDGSGAAHFVFAFPTVSMSDAPAVRVLARQLRDVDVGGGVKISASGEPMLMADILEIVERDAPRILLLTIVFVVLALRI
ncbi:MAG TPA: MMPL family transporter, partial [Polyangiaceae bacterium]